MTDDLLNTKAVARKDGDEALIIMKSYLETNPHMAQSHTPEAAAPAQPQARAQGPAVPGGGASRPAQQQAQPPRDHDGGASGG